MDRGSKTEMEDEVHQVVIIGGGICGLATALALHRKGIQSVVLERSSPPQHKISTGLGSAIGVQANGWRALDQLGVAAHLRQTADLISLVREVPVEKGKPSTETRLLGETRCLKRSELINTLANALPSGAVRYECKVSSLKMGTSNSYPVVHLQDGASVVAKVLIGCDGANSIIAKELGLKPTRVFQLSAVRSLTNYPNGHSFPNEMFRMRKQNISLGRIPITDKLVYWFLALRVPHTDTNIAQDPELIRKSMLELIKDIFPTEITEMVKNTDLGSLSLTHLRYRSPWDLLSEKSFRKGTVTVAGDAMHVMGPFLGQGGAAGLEDSVVLARHLAQKLNEIDQINVKPKSEVVIKMIGDAIDGYVKERRMRVVRLSAQSYFTGLLLDESSGMIMKLISIFLILVVFRNIAGPSEYDCGKL